MKTKLAAIILAAGAGERMQGRKKPLIPLYDKPMIMVLLEHLRACDAVEDVVVVLGCHAAACQAELPRNVETVINREWRKGKTGSFQRGLRAVLDWADGVFACPVDCPRVPCRVYHELAAAFPPGDAILVPTHGGVHGHPPLIPARFFSNYLRLAPDAPLDSVQHDPNTTVRYVEVSSPEVLDDFNTPADLPSA
ncbi:NTP transferase domain-containing protein [bacterium]|nr:NTP transferase domain-containing protein [bacterium]